MADAEQRHGETETGESPEVGSRMSESKGTRMMWRCCLREPRRPSCVARWLR